MREILLVGSLPKLDAAEVFRTAALLGDRLQRVPDGETGSRRSVWILCQQDALAQSGGFVRTDPDKIPEHKYSIRHPFELGQRGRSPGFKMGALDYADWARASYRQFELLKADGTIPKHWRFQVCLPTPLAVINRLVVPEDQPAAYPLYHAAMKREIGAIVDAIPHKELSIQIDIAPEFGFIEGLWSSEIGSSRERMLTNIIDLSDTLPAEVELGYHLCYGDFGHKHFVEPTDMAHLVNVANVLATEGSRRIDWIHMPVPRARSDASYFEPLKSLQIGDATLFLGLVHLTDGLAGTMAQIEAAALFRPEFGIATECGWGRRTPDQIAELIELHRSIQ